MISERAFSGLLAQIYEAAADFSRWPEALRAIAGAYDAPTVVFGAVGSNNQLLWQIAPGVGPEYHESYAAYYHRINPIIPIAMPSKVGSVLTDEMMLEKREFVRTEFFNDFLTPLDGGSMLGATVLSEEGLYCAIAVQRRPAFGAREIAFQRRLAPHLARAVQLNARLSALDRRSTASADALDRLSQGAIVVDSQARVLFANQEAERLTGPFGCLRIEGGALEARSTSLSLKLRALIGGCGAPHEEEAGGALGVSLSTARTHLARVFEKTDTRRQAQLVRLLLTGTSSPD
jgi:PAS domain-containing protein